MTNNYNLRQRNNSLEYKNITKNEKLSTYFNNEININEKIKINLDKYNNDFLKYEKYENINTFVFSSSEMYILSILGYIDKLIEHNILKNGLNNINTFISSSFGTIAIVYLSFGYTPKEILSIFFEYFKLKNDSILNIYKTFGIFDISYFIECLLNSLILKLGYIPTLNEIYKLTNKNCIFVSYCLNKSKVITYSYKNYPNVKINELIKNCCTVPIFFKKNENKGTQDLYVDYSFIDNREQNYIDFIDNLNNVNILNFKVNIIDNKYIFYDKHTNIFNYLKQLINITQNKVNINEKLNSNILIKNIEFNIKSYEQLLLLDDEQRYKELLNLYCFGYDIELPLVKLNNVNDKNEKDESLISKEEFKKYQGIVISGGGTNVFCLLGCIEYCLQNNIINLSEINVLIGTSAGSFVSVLLAMGFKINEITEMYTLQDLNSKFNIDITNIDVINNINITERISEKSIYSNKIILKIYDEMILKKTNGIIPTLLDIKNKYNKEVVICTFNLTTNKLEYLNYLNSPDLLVTHACAMSSCIPLVFNPIEYNKCFYVDGGMKENYPINCTEFYSDMNFIGFCLNFSSNYTKMNFLEYLIYFIFENARNNQEKMIRKSKNCTSYCFDIIYDNKREGQSLFCVNEKIILECINNGINFMKNKIESN